MKENRILRLTLLGALALLNPSCGPPTLESELKEILQKEYGKTAEEAEVGAVQGEREVHLNKVKKEGKDVYMPNYNSVKVEERLNQHKKMAEDLDSLLSFQNPKNVRLIDEFGMRDKLEKDEKAIAFNLDKLKLVALHNEFTTAMGLSEDEKPKISEATLIYPLAPIETTFEFDAKYVQEAYKAGLLQPFDELKFVYSFEMEVPNPAYPSTDNINKTIWIPRRVDLRIISYDVDFPKDHIVDYIEVYRASEKKPAIKIFHSASNPSLDVALIDVDKEGTPGYGNPDKVVDVWGIKKASDVYDNGKYLLVPALQEQDKMKLKRIRPLEKEMQIHIVKVGEIEYDLWTTDKNGYSVPIEYQAKDGQNYSLAYKLIEDKSVKPINGEQPKKLEWVAKRWMVPGTNRDVVGRVTTYHKVLPKYNTNIFSISTFGHEINIVRVNDVDISGRDSLFIEQEPYKITYDLGQSRWIIEDKDNNPKPKYEARREFAKPLFNELDCTEEDAEGCPR